MITFGVVVVLAVLCVWGSWMLHYAALGAAAHERIALAMERLAPAAEQIARVLKFEEPASGDVSPASGRQRVSREPALVVAAPQPAQPPTDDQTEVTLVSGAGPRAPAPPVDDDQVATRMMSREDLDRARRSTG